MFVHKLSAELGLKSKSYGKEEARAITVSKKANASAALTATATGGDKKGGGSTSQAIDAFDAMPLSWAPQNETLQLLSDVYNDNSFQQGDSNNKNNNSNSNNNNKKHRQHQTGAMHAKNSASPKRAEYYHEVQRLRRENPQFKSLQGE
jgi:hypothetical protein